MYLVEKEICGKYVSQKHLIQNKIVSKQYEKETIFVSLDIELRDLITLRYLIFC